MSSKPLSHGANQAPSTEKFRLDAFLFNYLSTLLFIIGGYLICTYVSGFHQRVLQSSMWIELFSTRHSFSIHDVFIALIVLYALVLVPYYALQPQLKSKTRVFLSELFICLTQRQYLSPSGQQAGLMLLLKFFFAPLMINWCLGHTADMFDKTNLVWRGIQANQDFMILFNTSLFMAAFQLILFVDTLLFTLGYIIEMPRLKNTIITVESTFLGWFVCLACYPPFNNATGQFFEWQSRDFPRFQDPTMHLVLNLGILVLMTIYSLSSVALGFKASNLTNRGIVSSGPYAFVRHPAYTAKNAAWWIGACPAIYLAFTQWGFKAGLYAITATAGWTFIYFMRAITEERHLLRTDNGYRQYMEKVRWRFIPGVF